LGVSGDEPNREGEKKSFLAKKVKNKLFSPNRLILVSNESYGLNIEIEKDFSLIRQPQAELWPDEVF